MNPFLHRMHMRVRHDGHEPVKIGPHILRRGDVRDIRGDHVDRDELNLAHVKGLVYIGCVIKGSLHQIVASPVVEDSEPAVEEVPAEKPAEEESALVAENVVAEEVPDIDSLKKPELVQMCEDLGLESDGYKSKLQRRLKEHFA